MANATERTSPARSAWPHLFPSAGLATWDSRPPVWDPTATAAPNPHVGREQGRAAAPVGSGRYPPGITGTKGKTGVFGFSPGGNASGASTPLGPSERMYR